MHPRLASCHPGQHTHTDTVITQQQSAIKQWSQHVSTSWRWEAMYSYTLRSSKDSALAWLGSGAGIKQSRKRISCKRDLRVTMCMTANSSEAARSEHAVTQEWYKPLQHNNVKAQDNCFYRNQSINQSINLFSQLCNNNTPQEYYVTDSVHSCWQLTHLGYHSDVLLKKKLNKQYLCLYWLLNVIIL